MGTTVILKLKGTEILYFPDFHELPLMNAV
jgi:hypothetical protein